MTDEKVMENVIVWPLCYIEGILHCMKIFDLNNVMEQLQAFASTEETGKDWELITVVALYLRSLEAVLDIDNSFNIVPFKISEGGIVTSVQVCYIASEDIRKLELYIRTSHHINRKIGAITICIPTYSGFPLFDIVLVYWKSATDFNSIGCQNKKGKATPNSNDMIPYWISKAILLRGDAPGKRWMYNKWIYYDKDSVIDILGYSLSRLYPSDWGTVCANTLKELGWRMWIN